MSDQDRDLQPPPGSRAADAPHPAPRAVRKSLRRSFGKAVERGFKTVIFGALGALMRLGGPRTPPDWSARPQRVLLLRYDRIGDMILISGIIRAIVQAQPLVSVDVLASAANAAVLKNNPDVGTVIVLRKRQVRSLLSAVWRIRRARYAAVLDPMFPRPSFTNMMLMWLSGARYRIGIAGRGNDYAMTLPVAPVSGAVHHVDHTAALLAAFGVDVDRITRAAAATAPPPLQGMPWCLPGTGWGIWTSRIYLSASEAQEGEARWHTTPALRLAVNVSSSSSERMWPEEHYVAVLNHVQARHPGVLPLVIGTPADAQRMERIAHSTGVQAAHTPHYRQMMAIVAACDLVFTVDTSVTHVASAFGKPVLVLFPGGGGDAFGPYSGGYTIATSGPTLASLEVEPALRALEALIVQVSAAPSQRTPRPLSA